MNTKDNKRKKEGHHDEDTKRKRKSTSPPLQNKHESEMWRKRHHSPDSYYKKQRDEPLHKSGKRDSPTRKAKDTDMLNTRTGGAYIPPARLRMMQAQITDKTSIAYQRLAWEALKKSIHGHINKINVGNIGIIIKELLKENIVRGRGLLCRSVIQAQAASPSFTNVYAALVAAVNSRFPNIGELLLKRLVIQFKRGFKRNDKPTCISSASFIAHLVNQRVAHEILALELLTLLVESPTDDSVEVSIAFLKECGQKLTEVSSKGVNAIFEMLRNILHEGQLDKRVQYMIEVMFQVWKDGFKDHPALLEELELVPEEEQFTHLLMLDDATDPQDILNVFKFDEKFEENEQKYKALSKDILGSDAESGDEEGSSESGSEESEEEEEEEEKKGDMTIIDKTETNLVALRRTIYLTINSSLDFEECAHKLLKMQLKPGQEVELCHMFLDCCAEQRTYEKFYGLLAQRFCNINRMYIGPFEDIFKDSYSTAHRLDTNRLRNVSKFFAHLLFTDSISWEVLSCVKLNEEDTTSSSRIYIKILFQELAEYMGMKKLNDRLQDPTLQEAFQGIFPRDNPKNTRFAINFFTSIGLGGLTDELREHLKQMPKNVPPPITEIAVDSDESSSSSSSSDDTSDSSSSDSEEESNKKKRDKKQSKNSSKDPVKEQANKEKERWGHSGFYEVYGESSNNNGSKPNDELNKDNFVRRNDRRDNRNREARTDRDNRRGEEKESSRGDRYVSGRDYKSRDERSSIGNSGSRRETNRVEDPSSDIREAHRKEISGRNYKSRDEPSSIRNSGSRKETNRIEDPSSDIREARRKEISGRNYKSRDEPCSIGNSESRTEKNRVKDPSSDIQRSRRKEISGRDYKSRDELSSIGNSWSRSETNRVKDPSSDKQGARRKENKRDTSEDRDCERRESGYQRESKEETSRNKKNRDEDRSSSRHEETDKSENRDKRTREASPSIEKEPKSYYKNSYYTIRDEKDRDSRQERYEEESNYNKQSEKAKKTDKHYHDEYNKSESKSDSSQDESIDRNYKKNKRDNKDKKKDDADHKKKGNKKSKYSEDETKEKKKSRKKKKEADDGWDIKNRKQLLKSNK